MINQTSNSLSLPSLSPSSSILSPLPPTPINKAMFTYDEIPEKNGYRLLSWNVRSLTARLQSFKQLQAQVQADFIFLQEIWQISPNLDVALSGFHPPIMQERQKKGGGVGIYIRNNKDYKKVPSPFTTKGLETIACQVTLDKKEYLLVNCYFAQLNKDEQISELKRYLLCQAKSYGRRIICAGDFNVDLMKVGTDTNSDYLTDALAGVYLVPQVHFPTRIQDVAGTVQSSLIDNIFCQTSLKPEVYSVAEGTSDHIPLIMDWGKTGKQRPEKVIVRPVTKQGLLHLEAALLKASWGDVCGAGSVDAAASAFEEKKDRLINKHLPTKQILIRPDKDQPWHTKGLKRCAKRLQRLMKGRRASLASNEYYLKYRSVYTKLCRGAKNSWLHDELVAAIKDSKRTWKVLDETMSRKRKGGSVSTLIRVQGQATTDKKKIANAFNEWYAGTGTRMSQKFPSNPNHQKYLKYREPVFDLKPIEPYKVKELIDGLQAKKSHGHDALTNELLKKFSYILYRPITSIINKSIHEAKVPDVWKKSRIIPLFKGGDALELVNYRPVSLCPVASKILEKVIYGQVFDYVQSESLIPETQYGFQKGNQTQHLIQKFLSIITEAVNNKKKVLVTYLDLSKAFDTVPHRAFLDKIYAMGFTIRTCHWFESFLTGRQQYVEYLGEMSCLMAVPCGVPQGTCLGPLVYLLYTADLNENIRFSLVLSFADDTTIITIGDTAAEIQRKIDEDYAVLTNWYADSRLSLNVDKTKFMAFNTGEIKVKLQGAEIQSTDSYKLVGLWIDSDLKWQSHLAAVTRKLRWAYAGLARVKFQLPTRSKLLLYHSLWRSHLIYGLAHYGAVTKAHIKRLQVLQNKTLRSVFNLGYKDNVLPMMKKHKLLTVEDEITLSRLMLTASCLQENTPDNIRRLVKVKPISRQTRAADRIELVVPNYKSEHLRRTSTYQMPHLFNALGSHAIESSYEAFKTQMKSAMIALY